MPPDGQSGMSTLAARNRRTALGLAGVALAVFLLTLAGYMA